MQVKFVSVHLDFSRRSVRRSQIDEMVGILGKIDGPFVLMGDFNTDWLTEDSSLKYLAVQLGLEVFEPHAEGLATYGDKGTRLDWILISPELSCNWGWKYSNPMPKALRLMATRARGWTGY
jgi:endonuclease/exonuclease/phosphatase family metal-dependent hydrolase